MADFKIKIEKANAGDPIQLTVHCVQGGPIVANPIATTFHFPGDPPHAEKELGEQVEGQVYYGTFDDPDDETTFVQVTARLKGGHVITKEHPLTAVNEECDSPA